VSVLPRKHEWTLGDVDGNNESLKSCSYHGQARSCLEKDFLRQPEDDVSKRLSFSEKWDQLRPSFRIGGTFLRKTSSKKQTLMAKECRSLNEWKSNSLAVDDGGCQTTESLDRSKKADCSRSRSFCKTMKSLTTRLVSRKKENKSKNIHRCSTWPSYSMNSFNPSFSKHLRSLAVGNEAMPRIEQVINDETAHEAFLQFTKNEYSEENLLFISEVEEFKKMENYEDKKLKADEIFTKYLNQNAPLEINITQETKMEITEQLPKLELTLFDKAQSNILTLLESNSFKRFINVSCRS